MIQSSIDNEYSYQNKKTALVIPTTMLVNFITTLSIATGSVVIMITSCVIENY